MPSGPKFTPHERELKIAECSELYLSGKSQNAIALKLEVSQQQISAYLKTLQKRWQVRAAEAIDAHKARELARLDRLECEHWEAWARSCEDAETTTIDNGSQGFKVGHVRKGQVGDPRFLDGVRACIEMRLKIVGGFADKTIVIKTPEDKIVEYLRAGKLDPAEVRARFPYKAEAWFAMAGVVALVTDPAGGQDSNAAE